MTKIVKLSDICIKITDGSHYSPEGVIKGFPMFSVKDMRDNGFSYDDCKYISAEEFENMKANGCVPQINDILIAKDGSYLKHIFIVTENKDEAVLSSIGILRPNSELVNPYYIKYYLSSDFVKEQVAKKYVSGSALPRIILKNFANIEIPMINMELQNKIVNVLKSIDDKIENNNRINAELESMAKTIYDYWFLQFEFPNEDGKPYKSSGGKMVWNEELKREIPEGWEVVQIGKILDKYPKTESVLRDDYEKGILFPIIDQSKDFICGYTDDKDKVLHLKDAIVFGDHTNLAKYINFDFARGADGTQIVVSKNKNLPNYLLYLQIVSLPVIEQGYSRHFKFLKEQFVFVPNKIVSEKYMKIIEDALLLIKKNIFENRELSLLRDFLLPMLMNGQIGFK